ncbi:dual specificity protein phosphatase family protein [Natronomonas halophila]|uniref:protein-tyrosine phosphatase family protein n=1 Tax=Natronomonas halophila TaxID=2747817 RepID=UPI0015B4B511|nr:dual specificity protein phosphatase family protein [Natronomonas halophila]QLD86235.1 dual specificity protein phosphatase family protein [Natronomonas halophila]
MTNLAPVAPDAPVFGVCRARFSDGDLDSWLDALDEAGIGRVVCVLSEAEAAEYGVPEAYADRFETRHTPLPAEGIPDDEALDAAVEAIRMGNYAGKRVAIHCDDGLGRTGLVAAAWLTRYHGYGPMEALDVVEAAGRAPRKTLPDLSDERLQDLLTTEDEDDEE